VKKPYCNWQVKEQAQKVGLKCVAEMEFNFNNFPGYLHQTTNSDAVKTFNTKDCRTYVFTRSASRTEQT